MIKLKTAVLKEAVTKAAKGSSKSPLIAITSAIGIEVDNDKLVLSTTDNTINTYVTVNLKNQNDKFFACTNCQLFSNLINKTSVENITLEIQNDCLIFTGNGVYNLPLILDEEGTISSIPEMKLDTMSEKLVKKLITLEDLKPFYKYNKLSVAKSFETPCLTNFCVSDSHIISFDNNTVCVSQIKIAGIKELFRKAISSLFEIISEKDITYYSDGVYFAFVSESVSIIGEHVNGIDEYPIKELLNLVNDDNFSNEVKVNKINLTNALDRLSLFVNEDDNKCLSLAFGKDSLILSNKSSSGCEQIMYIEKNEKPIQPSSMFVEINELKAFIDTIETEFVTLRYDGNNGVCIVCGNTKQIVPAVTFKEPDSEQLDSESNMEDVMQINETDGNSVSADAFIEEING